MSYDDEEFGPRELFSEQLHRDKYREPAETFLGGAVRVASALTEPGSERAEIVDMLADQRFLPAGRVMAAVGASKAVTPFNCYVSGTIPDSFVDRNNEFGSSIAHRAEQAAATMRMGGGIGYDFSTLRPENAPIAGIGGLSSGPLGFMPIYDAYCKATSSKGNRRGAQMGVLRVDHPDIRKYVKAKNNETFLTGFNTSIAITDEFMDALDGGKTFDLRFGGQVYDTVDAAELWEEIMISTHEWAEPGVLFVDTINRMNNLWYCETLSATNPCGEQPLPPFGACLLGSQNLVKYLTRQRDGLYAFDYEWFAEDARLAARMLDRVVDVALYPLAEQEREAKNKRRMGIGVTGEANAIEAMGFPYGSSGYLRILDGIHALQQRELYLEGTRMARERGAFPMLDLDLYMRSPTIQSLDDDVQAEIRKYGVRNSHYGSMAPTGTISMTADNVSSSGEPVYRYQVERTVNMPEGKIQVDLYDYGFKYLQVRGKRAAFSEVTAKEHVDVLVALQKRTDSAVSKTVNMDGNMPFSEFKQLYFDAYLGGAKGCTTFNSDGKRAGIFRVSPEPADLPFPNTNYAPQAPKKELELVGGVDSGLSCTWDPATGRRSCE